MAEDSPAPTLATPRLDLLPFSRDHVAFLHCLWTDREVRRYLLDDEVISEEEALRQVEASRESFAADGFGMWVVAEKASGEQVGFTGLRRFGEEGEIELLYGLMPSAWGRGLATEASRKVLRFAFEKLGVEEILAGADPPNAASFRVMERLGMTFHDRRVVDGLEVDYFVTNAARLLGSTAGS